MLKAERKSFATLPELQEYIKARWQGPDYIDGPNGFHTDYCRYTLQGCALCDLGKPIAEYADDGTVDCFGWQWTDFRPADVIAREQADIKWAKWEAKNL